jgi:DUF1009 family protein
MKAKKLGIIAGSGDLPLLIAKNYQSEKYIICIEGEADQSLYKDYSSVTIPIGKIQKLLDYLTLNEITDLVIVGKVRNKDLTKLLPDLQGTILLSRILKNKFLGDDKILTTIAKYFEEKGLNLMSLEEILALSDIHNESFTKDIAEEYLNDINLGFEVAKNLGKMDIGQSVIVENLRIIGVEAAEGTDELIKRCADFRIKKLNSGILVKTMKPNQDTRMDIPSIGVNTINLLAEHQYLGLAIEAKKVIIINPEEVFSLAKKLNLFIFQIKI